MDDYTYVLLLCFAFLEIVTITWSCFDKFCFPELSFRRLLVFDQALPFGGSFFIWTLLILTGYNNG